MRVLFQELSRVLCQAAACPHGHGAMQLVRFLKGDIARAVEEVAAASAQVPDRAPIPCNLHVHRCGVCHATGMHAMGQQACGGASLPECRVASLPVCKAALCWCLLAWRLWLRLCRSGPASPGCGTGCWTRRASHQTGRRPACMAPRPSRLRGGASARLTRMMQVRRCSGLHMLPLSCRAACMQV